MGLLHFKTPAEFDAYVRKDAAWRMDNIARRVSAMETREERKRFLTRWRLHHGEYSAEALQARVMEIWDKRRKSNAA